SRGNKLILIQANRVVSSFDLDVTGFSYLASTYSMPFTDMRGSVTGYNLFWCTGGDCVIWVDMIATDDGKRKSCVYRLNGKLRQLAFLEDTSDPVLSPNGKYVAFGSENSLYAYDLASWKLIGRLPGEKPVSYLWNDNASLFAGGEISVREWRLDPSFQTSGTVRTLFLSSVRNVYWKDDTRIVADSVLGGGNLFEYDTVRNTWQKTSMNLLSERLTHSVQNGRYRVFTGSTANGRYSNTLYVRTLSGKPVTRAVFLDTTVKVPVRRRVSIAFDAVDSADGLSNILSAVREYNVPATFFVNGEFIRRYPNETRQLALGGFECGSMFYTSADLTSKGFVVDEEFIRRGLARNEDEFFQTTGKELSLFWHAPLNRKNSVILKGGAQGGYRYIDTSRYSLDTVTLEMAVAKEGEYLSSSEIISRFVSNAADGDVITISTGISSGRRRDYLYENLDILISALLDNGFEIVQLK
ncbi:MAG: polysaccharide deacetylase family protein, partial [Treponema sp.]|nr:polysaccharide deacetylase family protein [Treponema sp.]